MAGVRPDGKRVVVYDDDHYYMGGALAELLASGGARGLSRHAGAAGLGVDDQHDGAEPDPQAAGRRSGSSSTSHALLVGADGGIVRSACTYTETEREHACDALVLVTARLPNDTLSEALAGGTELPRRCGWSATRGRPERLRRPSGTAAATRKSSTIRRRTATSRRSSARSSPSRRSRSGRGEALPRVTAGVGAGADRVAAAARRPRRRDGHPGSVELPTMAETRGEPADVVALLREHEGDPAPAPAGATGRDRRGGRSRRPPAVDRS